MSLLPRLCLMLVLSGLAAGCQTGTATTGAGDVTPNAITGDAIEVTALEATPAAAPATTAGAAESAATAVAAPAPEPGAAPSMPDAAMQAAGTDPATAPDDVATETAATDTEATPPEAEVVPPPPPKSELQIACERRRGTWEDTGGGLMICIRPTRDGGKRCTREGQCEGVCLARSGTCSPLDPLLGCHDILQDNGARATQCFE